MFSSNKKPAIKLSSDKTAITQSSKSNVIYFKVNFKVRYDN